MAFCRMDIFQGNYGYQGWNSDPMMGSGWGGFQGADRFTVLPPRHATRRPFGAFAVTKKFIR